MRYRDSVSLLTLFALGSIVTVTWGGDFWSRFKKDTHRNNYWPEPFATADRLAVREPFAIQTNNGWRLQNTIGDVYFEPDTQELNLAGQMKVKWVLTQSPMSRRTVYVMAATSDDVTMIRVDSVQRAISRYVPKGELPEVLLTDRDINGGSGDYYDAVDRALKESVPAPRLAPKSAPGSTGSTGSTGS
jgi:nitrogen fixation protein